MLYDCDTHRAYAKIDVTYLHTWSLSESFLHGHRCNRLLSGKSLLLRPAAFHSIDSVVSSQWSDPRQHSGSEMKRIDYFLMSLGAHELGITADGLPSHDV